MRIDVAVGEVPWERELLAALGGNREVMVGRRYVDLAAIDGGDELLITCPSVRGFTEATVRALQANRRVLVIVDSIRPPWIDGADLDIRDIADVAFEALVADCALCEPTPRLQLVRNVSRGRITGFVGVSGGVGVTTLAWMYAKHRPMSLLIDCNVDRPAVAMLVGNGARMSTLRSAIRALDRTGSVQIAEHATHRTGSAAVLGLSMHADDEVTADELARLLVAAAAQFPEVVLDGGALGTALLDAVLDSIDHVVLVTVATPLGMVRLCAQSQLWTQRATTVVVNRVRASAAGSRHAATAMRNLVESELGTVPLLVPDHVLDCDRGWLQGDWGAMTGALDGLDLPKSA